jgi:hypothetical protein
LFMVTLYPILFIKSVHTGSSIFFVAKSQSKADKESLGSCRDRFLLQVVIWLPSLCQGSETTEWETHICPRQRSIIPCGALSPFSDYFSHGIRTLPLKSYVTCCQKSLISSAKNYANRSYEYVSANSRRHVWAGHLSTSTKTKPPPP